jgi:hypothetical protein
MDNASHDFPYRSSLRGKNRSFSTTSAATDRHGVRRQLARLAFDSAGYGPARGCARSQRRVPRARTVGKEGEQLGTVDTKRLAIRHTAARNGGPGRRSLT